MKSKSACLSIIAVTAALLLGAALGVRAATYDASFAVEYSYSCLTGGCHETDRYLVQDYSEAFMTHVMVKCNACHGTMTQENVGKEKPNLTGYYPGIGKTGYKVPPDRCLVCHSAVPPKMLKKSCMDCHHHRPHVFPGRWCCYR